MAVTLGITSYERVDEYKQYMAVDIICIAVTFAAYMLELMFLKNRFTFHETDKKWECMC